MRLARSDRNPARPVTDVALLPWRVRHGEAARPFARRPWLALLGAIGLAALHPGCARSAAFNEPAGQGIVILDGTFEGGDRAFDQGGHRVKTDRYTKREGSAYIEYGVTDWLQAIIKPDLVSVGLGGSPGGHYSGLGTSEAGAQLRLLMFGPAVLAVQGTFQLPASTRRRNLALIGNTSRNTDARALVGVGFELGPWPSFLDAEAGYRMRDGGAPDEIHLDLTLGTRPRPDVLLLLQDFTTLATGAGTAWFPHSQYSNLQGSIVYDINSRWSVQVGLLMTIEGRNALRERGIHTALWYRF